MQSVGAYEAKTHLPRLLERVARGETITITRHGVPVAVLTPPPALRTVSTDEAIRALRALRLGTRPDGMSLRELIAEGRRS